MFPGGGADAFGSFGAPDSSTDAGADAFGSFGAPATVGADTFGSFGAPATGGGDDGFGSFGAPATGGGDDGFGSFGAPATTTDTGADAFGSFGAPAATTGGDGFGSFGAAPTTTTPAAVVTATPPALATADWLTSTITTMLTGTDQDIKGMLLERFPLIHDSAATHPHITAMLGDVSSPCLWKSMCDSAASKKLAVSFRHSLMERSLATHTGPHTLA